MKKIAKILAAIMMMSAVTVATLPTQEVAAAQGYDCQTHFMGLRAWYDGLVDAATCEVNYPGQGDEEAIKEFVWTAVLNVVSMVLGIMGYLAIGFVIYGGIQYMIGQGDPNKVAKGKRTITNSVIGLIIVMSASIISGVIADIVSGARDSGENGSNFFLEIFNKVFIWSGVVAVIMIVYGGIQYITSTGNPQGITKAKTTILYSVIGLLVVLFASAIVNVVVSGI
ncbi:hypothetical protein IKG13_01905 [Candidatus Saccharibacteria bacterium]|nr:hypothetical protein [Candidatus Saccharibacteria bacterium]MBR3378496.1 hypothetical protein [Candidatus Saccharibacteria bacterium]